MESRGKGSGEENTKLELFAAASNKDPELAALLITKKADVNKKGPTSYTPLHIAAQWDSSEVSSLLLAAKANPNLKTRDGRTALHLAAGKNSVAVAIQLLESGAKKNVKSEAGDFPLDLAIKANQAEMIELLRENGAKSKNDPRPDGQAGQVIQAGQAAVQADAKEAKAIKDMISQGELARPRMSLLPRVRRTVSRPFSTPEHFTGRPSQRPAAARRYLGECSSPW